MARAPVHNTGACLCKKSILIILSWSYSYNCVDLIDHALMLLIQSFESHNFSVYIFILKQNLYYLISFVIEQVK